jgi:hypothetical protein
MTPPPKEYEVLSQMGWPNGSSDRGSQSLLENLVHAGFMDISVVRSGRAADIIARASFPQQSLRHLVRVRL